MTTGDQILAVLQGYNVKSEGGGKYRSNTPWRAGSAGMALSLTIHPDGEHGWFKEYRDNVTGSLYDLAGRLGIDTPTGTRAPVADTKRGYKDLGDYATAHGVTRDVFEAAGWSDGTGNGRPRITYKTANGERARFIDGDAPHYISPKGYKTCWYGLNRAIEMAQQTGRPLTLVNGEASVVVAQHYGIPAFAKTAGEGAIPDDLVAEYKSKTPESFLIGLDCDAKGRSAAAKVAVQFPESTVIDWGLGDKGDAADFCMLHGDHAPQRLNELAAQPPKPAPEIKLDPLQTLKEVTREVKQATRLGTGDDGLNGAIQKAKDALAILEQEYAKPRLVDGVDVVAGLMEDMTFAVQHRDRLAGLSSGFDELDAQTWGFQGGKLYAFYAATSMGKTAILTQIASTMLLGRGTSEAAPGVIVASESGHKRWMRRVICAEARIDEKTITRGWGNASQQTRYRQAGSLIAATGFQSADGSMPTIANVVASIYAGVERGCKWVIVDGINNISVPGASLFDKTSMVIDTLQSVAIDCNVPLLFSSQMARNDKARLEKSEPDLRPRLQDAQGSHRVEQNSDFVFGLYRHDYYTVRYGLDDDPACPAGHTQLITLKARDDDEYVGSSMLLRWNGYGFNGTRDKEHKTA